MSVSGVNALSMNLLTVLSIIYQGLYKIVYMSIYTIDIKIILQKEKIGEKREYLDTLTNPSSSLVTRLLVSNCTLTILLTTDKKRARFGYYFIKYVLASGYSNLTLNAKVGNGLVKGYKKEGKIINLREVKAPNRMANHNLALITE